MKNFLNLAIILGCFFLLNACEVNKKPSGSIMLEKTSVLPEETIKAIAAVSDANDDEITLTWTVSGGNLDYGTSTDTVEWTTPAFEGSHSISVNASDGFYDVDIKENLEVKACDYYDQYNNSKGNIAQTDVDAGIFEGKAYLSVDYGATNNYGSLVTTLSEYNVDLNNALLSFGYEPYDDGYISFVFYFEVDESHVGGQLEAIQLDLKPMDTENNWTLTYKWKDYSDGSYYWDYLDANSTGYESLISTIYNKDFQDVRLERTSDNHLNFYFEDKLVYSSTGITNQLASGTIFDPTINRVRFYVYNDTYMEVDYFYLYQ